MDKQPFFTLGVAILAILSAWGAIYFTEFVKQRNLRKSLAGAFIGEINAALNIVEKRQYIEDLREILKQQKMAVKEERGSSTKTHHHYSFSVSREPFPVWDKCLTNIGIFETPIPQNLAMFYSQAYSILEDINAMEKEKKEGIALSQKDNSKRLQQVVELFDDSKELAVEIIRDLEQIRDQKLLDKLLSRVPSVKKFPRWKS